MYVAVKGSRCPAHSGDGNRSSLPLSSPPAAPSALRRAPFLLVAIHLWCRRRHLPPSAAALFSSSALEPKQSPKRQVYFSAVLADRTIQTELLLLIREQMGLLSIIRKIKRKEKEMRILMVGLDNSGKTTIVLKINGEDTSVISPTLGFNIKTIRYQKYSLNIWDVGGQKTIRSYWRNYFEQTDGLVWVVDSSDLRRLDDCKAELDNLLKEEVLNLDAMDKTRHWRIVGCSAYTGEGLLKGFDWLVQDIASRIYVLD